jgi:hypothetical protein
MQFPVIAAIEVSRGHCCISGRLILKRQPMMSSVFLCIISFVSHIFIQLASATINRANTKLCHTDGGHKATLATHTFIPPFPTATPTGRHT